MVSLQRYTIRLSIAITLLITLVGGAIIVTTYSGVQNNISTIQSSRTTYLDQDSQILSITENFTTTLQTYVKQQAQLILNASVNIGPIGNLQVFDIYNQMFEVNDLLQAREVQNYVIEDLTTGPFGLANLGLEEIQTNDIIERTSTGAYGSINAFLLSTFNQFDILSDNIDNNIQFLVNNKTSLTVQDSQLEEHVEEYNVNVTDFEASLYSNGTQEANDILNVFELIKSNYTNVRHGYHHAVYKMGTDPTGVDISELQNRIGNGTININNAINQIETLGLNPGDAAIFNDLSTNVGLVMDQFQINLESLNGVVVAQTDLNNQLTELNNLEDEAIQTVVTVTSTVNAEREEFQERSSDYISELRNRLNTNVIYIFAALAAIVGILFMFIFITLTVSMGRILNKNLKLAEGDLTIEPRESYGGNEIGLIEQSVDTFAVQIKSIISQMRETSETLAGISEELAAGAEEASASINEVNATVREFSSGSAEQNLMLGRVRDELMEHLNVVEQTANRIDDTANFVERVAKRTNILGLNASIEAAKAGRFGLGFDVVAQEVRNLSNDTKESASEIAQSIDEIEINIRQTVQDILTEVNIIREVAQNTATGSEDASIATQEQVTMMNEVSETSNQLSELSQILNEMLQNFKISK